MPKIHTKQPKNKSSSHHHHSHSHKHSKHEQKQQQVEQVPKIQQIDPELNILPYKCDNCNKTTSYCFCEQCKRVYCYQCWTQLHQQALNDHTRILDRNIIEQLNKFCPQHNLKATFWCITCQQPLCELCLETHNKLHQVLTVQQAQVTLQLKLRELLQNENHQKFEEIYQNYLAALSVTQSEADLYMKEIESQTQNLRNALKMKTGEKLVEIQSYKDDLESIIEAYKQIQSNYDSNTLNIQKIIQSLQKIDKIQSINPEIYQLALNKYSPHINWTPDTQNQKLNLLTEQIKLLKFEHENEINQYIQELSRYEKLVNSYQQLVSTQQLTCLWCGQKLNKNSVNSCCSENKKDFKNQSERLEFLSQKSKNMQNFDFKTAEKQIGNQQHFWI